MKTAATVILLTAVIAHGQSTTQPTLNELLPLPAEYSPVASPQSVVEWGSARFTAVADGLLRLEAVDPTANTTDFDDRASFVVVNRLNPAPATLQVSHPNSTAIQISTGRLTIVHDTSGYGLGGNMTCSASEWLNGTDQVGGTRTSGNPNGTHVSGPGECCALCSADRECGTWVFATAAARNGASVNCWSLYGVKTTKQASDRIAGGAVGPSAVFNRATLSITLAASGLEWRPGDANPDALPGSVRGDFSCSNGMLIQDCAKDVRARVQPSVLSRAGWALLDDTASTRLQAGTNATVAAGVTWFNSTKTNDIADWYFFSYEAAAGGQQSGPQLQEGLRQLAMLTGRPKMPPRSALGLWWSHYYPFSEDEYNEQVLQGYKQHGLPLNHAVLDLAWHKRNFPGEQACKGYGGFLWNTTLFSNPAAFLQGLRDGTSPYGRPLEFLGNLHVQEGVDHCQGPGYQTLAQRMGLPTDKNQTIECQLGDPTFAQGLFELFLDAPAPSMSGDEVGGLTGSGAWPYRWTDYGGCGSNPPEKLLWNNILFGGHVEATTSKRALVLSRNGGLGQGRTPVFFTGDTEQCFGTIAYQVALTPSNAADLVGYTSHDIGGFKEDRTGGSGCVGSWQGGNNTQGELYLRWLQFGAFLPIMRTHCTMCVGRDTFAPCNYCERRIWEWPDLYPAMRDAMLLRNALVPYLYTAARAFFDSGVAPLRPLYFDHPTEAQAYATAETQYAFGPAIVVAPVSQPAAASDGAGAASGEWLLTGPSVDMSVWLPPLAGGAHWSSLDGSKAFAGNTTVSDAVSLSSIAAYAPAGSLLPTRTMADAGNNASFADPAVWTAFVPPGASSQGTRTAMLYEDEGNTRTYEAVPDMSSCSTVAGSNCVTTTATSSLDEGHFVADLSVPKAVSSPSSKSNRNVHFHLRGGGARPGKPTAVQANGKALDPIAPTSDPSAVGWFVVADSTTPLTLPDGTLVIQAGTVPLVDMTFHLDVSW